jgi:thymidine phosphorylase
VTPAPDIDALFAAALAARERAYAPYSGYRVGAALADESGRVFAGCNVENAAYPVGTCAEAGAIAAMAAGGGRRIATILVVADGPALVAPCGACRQRIREFAGDDALVHLADPGGVRRTRRSASCCRSPSGPTTSPGRARGDDLPAPGGDPPKARRRRSGRERDRGLHRRPDAGRVTDAQAAALAMAIVWRGLGMAECVRLTRAMTRSGTVLSWDLPGPVLDKHSTGGVGDTVSLALAPAVAACGGYVPMISGRGLGHTGGTLDKLDAVPGYRSQPDLASFRKVVGEVGCAVIGQTIELAPADQRLYAIRDVTGTVESIDLITASILSKKLAAGLDGLVMDVKVGSGAFMARMPDALALAERIGTVANGAGLPTTALITDMDAPLASAAGNAVEVAYAADYLTGRRRETRFHEVTVALGAEMLRLGSLAAQRRGGAPADGGRGRERPRRGALGPHGRGARWPADLVEHPARHLATAPSFAPSSRLRPAASRRSTPGRSGSPWWRSAADGPGRRTRSIPAVGLTDLAAIGEAVGEGAPLATIIARAEASAKAANRGGAARLFGRRARAAPNPSSANAGRPPS